MTNREKARKQAQALVSQMTVEEKASQLRYDAPAIERLGIPAITGGEKRCMVWRGKAWLPVSRRR